MVDRIARLADELCPVPIGNSRLLAYLAKDPIVKSPRINTCQRHENNSPASPCTCYGSGADRRAHYSAPVNANQWIRASSRSGGATLEHISTWSQDQVWINGRRIMCDPCAARLIAELLPDHDPEIHDPKDIRLGQLLRRAGFVRSPITSAHTVCDMCGDSLTSSNSAAASQASDRARVDALNRITSIAAKNAGITSGTLDEGDRTPTALISWARALQSTLNSGQGLTRDKDQATATASKRTTGRVTRSPKTGKATIQPLSVSAVDSGNAIAGSSGARSRARHTLRGRTAIDAIDRALAKSRGEIDEPREYHPLEIQDFARSYRQACDRKSKKFFRSCARSFCRKHDLGWSAYAHLFRGEQTTR